MRLIFLSFIIITIPLSFSSISKFKFDVRRKLKIPQSKFTYIDQNNYINERNNGLRIQRAAINSFNIDNNILELYISYYKSDESLIRDIKANVDKYKIVKPDADMDELDQTEINQIFIDDELIDVKGWFLKKVIENSQKFLTTEIPIDNLSYGYHTLKIKRLRWRLKNKVFVVTDEWANISFKKSSYEIRN